METFRTDQEEFWAGEFGNDYIETKPVCERGSEATQPYFHGILSRTGRIDSAVRIRRKCSG